MKIATITTIAAALALSACAQSPGAIAPVSMAGAYDHLSCRSARGQLAEERQALAALETAQRSAVTGDAIGVFLIGVPASSLSGGDRAGDIAVSKGRVIALENRVTRC